MMNSTLEISEARKGFNTMDERLRRDRVVVVTRHNRQVFAFVDLEYMDALLETIEVLSDPDAMTMLRDAISNVSNGQLHSHEDVARQLG